MGCSLEGEEFEENERIRAEIREEEAVALVKKSRPLDVRRALKLSQDLLDLVRKLNLQPQIALCLVYRALPAALHARKTGLRGPDPRSVKEEALEYSNKFGASMMYTYNKMYEML